jgi:DHA2 family multidrug resistance protein
MAGAMEHMTSFDTLASFRELAIARCFQTIGMAFLFVPINTAAYIGLPPGKVNEASALINTMRNLGGSLGVSVANTLVERRAQFHQDRLVSHLTPFDSLYNQDLSSAAKRLMQQGATPSVAPSQALGSIYRTLTNQATMLSYIDVFRILAIGSLLAIGLAVFLRKVEPGKKRVGAH